MSLPECINLWATASRCLERDGDVIEEDDMTLADNIKTAVIAIWPYISYFKEIKGKNVWRKSYNIPHPYRNHPFGLRGKLGSV